ncbi:MAG: redoxin domain-containing protein [Maribacter sp.]|nr:redoxin domain-containing protein [Maribacter sp.]
MKKSVLIFFLILVCSVQAQYSISGTFMPANDYKWLIAYRLKPGTQNYVADTAVKNGEFSFKIPENSGPGTYRLVYAVPQEEFFIDVIYSGKENIEFTFNATEGVSFISSEENKLFNSYFRKIYDLEKQFARYYTNQNTEINEYQSIARKMDQIQKMYEEKTAGMMVHDFVKANHPYIPSNYESVFQYVKNKKDTYFEALELNNTVLQASGFLSDKLTNYVFTALPLDTTTKDETESAQIENVDTVSTRIQDLDSKYKLHLFHTLWAQAAASSFDRTSDYIYDTYLEKLLAHGDNQEISQQIEVHNRLRIGATAPNIEWGENESRNDLRNLEGADKYLLVFWSSSCSHCLRELPALHKKLKNNDSIRVIAIGLEDDNLTWKAESSKMPHFEHVIALGKWESEYADLYAIDQTPTYFILDKDKKIRAKPESDKAVVELLENQ